MVVKNSEGISLQNSTKLSHNARVGVIDPPACGTAKNVSMGQGAPVRSVWRIYVGKIGGRILQGIQYCEVCHGKVVLGP